jgi:hypothetical protein
VGDAVTADLGSGNYLFEYGNWFASTQQIGRQV